MRVKRLITTILLVLCLGMVGPGTAAAQDIIDLVFCMDGSASMGPSGWAAQINGTAAAILNSLPHDGSIRITIIQFSDDSTLEIAPTILTGTNAAGVANQVSMLGYDQGNTNTASCIDMAAGVLDGLMPQSTTQIIDVSTDGLANLPGSDPAGTAITAAENAIAGGVDQINALGIGLDDVGQAFLDDLVLPQDGQPTDGFVINIENFGAYQAAIAEKVEREIGMCARLDDYVATCATDASGVVNVTLTFTNFLTDGDGVPFDAEHVWITDPSLVGDPGAVVSVSPNYFSFQGDPICSAADPACVDPTRTISFTVFGAPDGGQLEFTFELHDEDYEPCCEDTFVIELPDCDCGQVLDEIVYCVWSWPPPPNFFYNFTFQNLFSEVVEEIRLTPVSPPFPLIEFNPNIIDGLSLAPPPTAGTSTNTVQITGPAAVSGQHIEFIISTHNEEGFCCSIKREIDLPYHCFWKPKPYPWPVYSKEIFVSPLEVGYLVSGFGASGHGVTIPTDHADGVVVSLGVADSAAAAGSYLRLESSGSIKGRETALSGVTLTSGRGATQVTMDSALGMVGAVELYLDGKSILGTSLDARNSITLPEGAWPSSLAFQGSDGALSLSLPKAAVITVAGQAVVADQVVFGVATAMSADVLTGVTITGDGIGAVTVDAKVYPAAEDR